MGSVLDALWDADPIKWVPKTNNGNDLYIFYRELFRYTIVFVSCIDLKLISDTYLK